MERAAIRALIALPFVLAAVYYALHPALILNPDSACYLAWCPVRTSGYPLFLRLANGPFLLPIQLGLFAASGSWATGYFYRLSGSLFMAALLCGGLLVNPFIWQLQGSVMSEALTTPLLIVLLGLIAGYMVRGRSWLILLSAVVAGVLTATRPSNLPLVVAPVLAVLLSHKRRLIAPCLALALMPIAADTHEKSLLGRHMFAKSVLIAAPPIDRSALDPTERKLATLAETDFAPIRNTLKPPPPRVLDVLEPNYEVCLQYACTPPASDRALLHVGLMRLRENPVGYLELTAREYWRLWALHPRKHPDLAREYNAYLASAPPLPFRQSLGPDVAAVSQGEQSQFYRFNRALFLLLGFGAPLLTVALLRSRNPFLKAALVYVVSAQLVLLFCALVGIGSPRYTMGMWPMIAGAVALGLAALNQYRADHYRLRQRPEADVANVDGAGASPEPMRVDGV